MSSQLHRITQAPEYHALLHKRSQLIWPLTFVTIASYVAFILAIAFEPQALGTPIHDGSVVSIGIVLGLALIILNFVITLLYVRGANRTIEPLIAKVHAAVGEK